eukprot:5342018-Pleurochrysis_carterae.AAC.1
MQAARAATWSPMSTQHLAMTKMALAVVMSKEAATIAAIEIVTAAATAAATTVTAEAVMTA